MTIKTHHKINQSLCGTPVLVEEGHCIIEFTAIEAMAADDTGLVHGGFVFGLADYGAMLAINHPNVVLGSSTVKFLKPVKVGEALVAEANVIDIQGKKHQVSVMVTRDNEPVFQGDLTCFIPPKHVLAES
ncbi:MAG: thioesterase [Proteobacteria bacterium]|nr:thioesterase [Pseudomonadota bacterium]